MTNMDDAWEEWEDEAAPASTDTISVNQAQDYQSKTQEIPASPHSSISDAGEEWGWSLSELEKEIATLTPSNSSLFDASDASNSQELTLLTALDELPSKIQSSSSKLQILGSLGAVAQLHVLAARQSFPHIKSDPDEAGKQVQSLKAQLQQVAGEWGDKELLRTTLGDLEQQQLEEMTGLLQHALQAENEDLTLFQEVLEQLFEGLKDQTLVLSTNWLESEEQQQMVVVENTLPNYLHQILTLFNEDPTNTTRILELSEAEIFQDAKDIGRDELLINGVKVEGTRGYDAVVDALQHELEHVLAQEIGKTPEMMSMDTSNALQAVAMAVLHASNRTESGGSAYELLAKFISNHEVDRVLLRPASARAAPLEVHMDVGPYLESVPGSKEPTWAFGLRVKLVAVTWYLVCDADDPTDELFELETSFCTRLAFPIGLTPFHPLDSMRKDRGAVALRLVLQTEVN